MTPCTTQEPRDSAQDLSVDSAGTVTENSKVGESDQEQKAPESTLARERMIEIIANNKIVMQDSEKILVLINADPSLDGAFCRLFGIKPMVNK